MSVEGKVAGKVAGAAVGGGIQGKLVEKLINDHFDKLKKEIIEGKTDRGKLYRRKFIEAANKGGDTSGIDKQEHSPEEYAVSFKDRAIPMALRGGAAAVDAVGKGYNLYNSVLGQALLAMSQSAVPQRSAEIYGNPYAAGAPIAAAPYMIKGGLAKVASDAVSGFMNDAAEEIANNAERDRMAKIMVEQNPSGSFYDSYRKAGNYGNRPAKSSR